jgi:hypothetical protein
MHDPLASAFSPGGQGKPGFPVFLTSNKNIYINSFSYSLVPFCCHFFHIFSSHVAFQNAQNSGPLNFKYWIRGKTRHCPMYAREEAIPRWHPLVKKKRRINQSGLPSWHCPPVISQQGAKGSHWALGFTPIKWKHQRQRKHMHFYHIIV